MGVFDLGDDSARVIPGAGRVVEVREPAHFGAELGIAGLSLPLQVSGQAIQPLILGDAHDVTHLVAFTPRQHPPAAKARVAAEDDLDLRPGLAQPLDQQGQNGPGMFGAVDLARAQVADQQLVSAKDIQGQEAVMVVVTVKEAPFLAAMDGIVGGIEVQDQALGHALFGGNELLNDDLVHAPSRFPVGPVFPAAQGGRAGQRHAAAQRGLDRQVAAQCLVVVEVFITQGQSVNPLPQQAQAIVVNTGLAPWILQDPGDRFGQAQATVDLLQQQHAAIGSDVTALKIGFDTAALTGWKLKRFLGTVCHRQNLSDIRLKQLNYIGFIKVLPFYS
jgi:hypothetical protein